MNHLRTAVEKYGSLCTLRPWPRAGKSWLLGLLLLLLSASGGCKESQWKLWKSYQSHFIDAEGRVFDPSGDQHTTSEGQAYALFFALAAGDQPCFDHLLGWTRANLAGGDLENHLPAWLWGKAADGVWKQLDPNSAADADLWMAYTLVEAGRLWNNPTYSYIGLRMASLIAKSEVADLPGFGQMLLPGAVGFHHDNHWMVNPSYLPVFIFDRLAVVDPGGPWGAIGANVPRLLAMGARHGYVMDWLDYIPGDGFYPAVLPKPGVPSADQPAAVGSYDAIRVYLWAGMIADEHKRALVLNSIPSMGAYLGTHDAPPEKVSDQGIPLEQDGPVGFSAALLPYLRVYDLSRVASKQIARLNSMRDSSSGLYGKDLSYYDQNLSLFATGFLDSRFRFGAEGELKVDWKRR